MVRWKTFVTAAASLATFVACGAKHPPMQGDPSSGSGPADEASTSPPGFSSSSSGGLGGETISSKECAATEAQASLAQRPVDIIFVIDNSGSMTSEIEEVQDQINANFASIIDKSGIDYRVIMLSRHGASSSVRVCVRSPLSGTTCDPVPTQPAETSRFVHHSVTISSHDAWCRILLGFDGPDEFSLHPNGFKDALRTEAFKIFVVITDDNVNTSCTVHGVARKFNDGDTLANGDTAAAAFDAALLELSPEQFGTATTRNYSFHSIVGLAPYDANDLTLAYPPNAAATTSRCTPGSVRAGTGYQALSRLTSGLRYPSCGLEYTTIFQAMAQGVIEGAIQCDFDVPPPPQGQKLDLKSIVVRYTPEGTKPPVDFQQVADATACHEGSFYLEGERIKLCPETCGTVRKDRSAQIRVLFGCDSQGAN